MLERAIAFAVDAHAGQLRRDGRTPYIIHPLRVMLACPDDEVIRTAAVLHDVVEDCKVPLEIIEICFGAAVRAAVDALSRRDETYGQFIERANQEPNGRVVKIVDIFDNLGDDLDALPADEATGMRRRYIQALMVLLGRSPTWPHAGILYRGADSCREMSDAAWGSYLTTIWTQELANR